MINRDIERESDEFDFANFEIPQAELKKRAQDRGCSKAELKVYDIEQV